MALLSVLLSINTNKVVYITAHNSRELARDGKAEPRAAEVLRGRPVGLAELLEQLCLVLCSHGQA
jgi:hypothetical protein